MFIAFIPFSAQLLGQYPTQRVAVVVYGLNLVVVGITLYLVWWYASARHRLVDPDLEPATIRIATRRILTGPLVYLIAIVISPVSLPLTLIVYAAVPLLYILPARLDRSWLRR